MSADGVAASQQEQDKQAQDNESGNSSHAGFIVLEILFAIIGIVYFAAFVAAIVGLPVRADWANSYVSAITGITPQLLPVIPFDVTQGSANIGFLVIFIIAVVAFWLSSKKLRSLRTIDHDARRKQAFDEIDKAFDNPIGKESNS